MLSLCIVLASVSGVLYMEATSSSAWETGMSSLQALQSTKSQRLVLWETFAPLLKWDQGSDSAQALKCHRSTLSAQAGHIFNYTSLVIFESLCFALAVNNNYKSQRLHLNHALSDQHMKLTGKPCLNKNYRSTKTEAKMKKMSNSN